MARRIKGNLAVCLLNVKAEHISILYFIYDNYYNVTCCIENSVWTLISIRSKQTGSILFTSVLISAFKLF